MGRFTPLPGQTNRGNTKLLAASVVSRTSRRMASVLRRRRGRDSGNDMPPRVAELRRVRENRPAPGLVSAAEIARFHSGARARKAPAKEAEMRIAGMVAAGLL